MLLIEDTNSPGKYKTPNVITVQDYRSGTIGTIEQWERLLKGLKFNVKRLEAEIARVKREEGE